MHVSPLYLYRLSSLTIVKLWDFPFLFPRLLGVRDLHLARVRCNRVKPKYSVVHKEYS